MTELEREFSDLMIGLFYAGHDRNIKKYLDLMADGWELYDRVDSKGTTLPVDSVEDPSEYLPTNSTQTLNHGL